MSNPFASGNAAAIHNLFANQVRCPSSSFDSPVWRDRAVALVGYVAPTLVWLRDHKGVTLDFEAVRFATDLGWITRVLEGFVSLRDPAFGEITELDVRGQLPDQVVSPLRLYLSETPGYDLAIPLAQQTRVALDQHSFVAVSFLLNFDQHRLNS